MLRISPTLALIAVLGTAAAPPRAAVQRAGRLTVLLLDDMTLPLSLAGRAQDVARRFVNRMLPGDRMAIVSLDGSAMELTDDRTRLLRTIAAYGVRSAGLMPIDRL